MITESKYSSLNAVSVNYNSIETFVIGSIGLIIQYKIHYS